MNYSVPCACGVTHAISATQAGSRIDCRCGRLLDIPALSELRTAKGESPIELGTVRTIRAMIRDGLLPDGDICPYSGRPANDTVFFQVQCERTYVRSEDTLSTGEILVYVFLLSWIYGLIELFKTHPREVHGRDTILDVPVRISSDERQSVLRIRRQKKLKQLLSHTPIYRELLREFPQATITALHNA